MERKLELQKRISHLSTNALKCQLFVCEFILQTGSEKLIKETPVPTCCRYEYRIIHHHTKTNKARVHSAAALQSVQNIKCLSQENDDDSFSFTEFRTSCTQTKVT